MVLLHGVVHEMMLCWCCRRHPDRVASCAGFKVELDDHAKVGLPAPYMLAIQEQPGVVIFKDAVIENVEVPIGDDPLNLFTIFKSTVHFEGLVMRNCSTGHYYQWLMRLQISTVTIKGARFERNRCSNGILGSSDGPLMLSNTTFSDNVQLLPSYMLWMGFYLNATASQVLGCTFRNNSGLQAMLVTVDTVPVEFRACRIENNGLTGGLILQVRLPGPSPPLPLSRACCTVPLV
jgi:hypothetical protein